MLGADTIGPNIIGLILCRDTL